jgi:hypothetical protein
MLEVLPPWPIQSVRKHFIKEAPDFTMELWGFPISKVKFHISIQRMNDGHSGCLEHVEVRSASNCSVKEEYSHHTPEWSPHQTINPGKFTALFTWMSWLSGGQYTQLWWFTKPLNLNEASSDKTTLSTNPTFSSTFPWNHIQNSSLWWGLSSFPFRSFLESSVHLHCSFQSHNITFFSFVVWIALTP